MTRILVNTPPNIRLKLTAPVLEGRIAFVILTVRAAA